MSRPVTLSIAADADRAIVHDHRLDSLDLVATSALDHRSIVLHVTRGTHRSHPRDHCICQPSPATAIAGFPWPVLTRVAGGTDRAVLRQKSTRRCRPAASNALVARTVTTRVAPAADWLASAQPEHRGCVPVTIVTCLDRTVIAALPYHQAVVPLVWDVPILSADTASPRPPAPTPRSAIRAHSDVTDDLVPFIVLRGQIRDTPLVAARAFLPFVPLARTRAVRGVVSADALPTSANGADHGVERHGDLLTQSAMTHKDRLGIQRFTQYDVVVGPR